MATKMKISKEHDLGLYDSETGKSLRAKGVVGITDECPSGERTILFFAQAKRGRLVQIAHPYQDEAYRGSRIHFFVDEIDAEFRVSPRDDTFELTAKRAGLSRRGLQAIILANEP